MKRICFLLCAWIFLIQNFVQAQTFIFPVKSDVASDVLSNTVSPLLSGGGWYVNNTFGVDWTEIFEGYSPGGEDYPYHPGIDYNRYDGDEDDGNDVPVYSIGNGTVIRVKDMDSNGWVILIRYELESITDLSSYIIPGTTPTSAIQNASSIVAMYLHLSGNALGLSSGDHRPPNPKIMVTRGQLLGYISSDLRHLHFEIRAGSNDQTGAVNEHQNSGYYDEQQEITNFGNLNPEALISNYTSGTPAGYYSDGWHADGTSDKFLNAYLSNGGSEFLGVPNDRGEGYYVHQRTIVLGSQTLTVWVQDFKNTEGHYSQLVLNPNDVNVYVVHGQILAWWRVHGVEVGYPMENELGGSYAGSANGSGTGSLGSQGDQIAVQRFDHNKTGDGFPVNTVCYNTASGLLGHYPVGKFKILEHIDEPLPPNTQYYFRVKSIWTQPIDPWPQQGVSVPTEGLWWTDADHYEFFWVDESNNERNLLSHEIEQGNDQFFTPGLQLFVPMNLSSEAVSTSEIALTWQDFNNPDGATTYKVYRNGYFKTNVSTLGYNDTGLSSGTSYVYQVSAVYNGVESELTPGSLETTQGTAGSSNHDPITLTGPHGGHYDIGSSMTITWSGSDWPVRIELTRDNGTTWEHIIDFGGAHSYTWNDIPGPDSDECLVRVSDLAFPEINSVSMTPITIGNPNSPPVTVNATVDVIYPNQLTVDMTPYCSDPDGNLDLGSLVVTNASIGEVVVDGMNIVFTPAYRTGGIGEISFNIKDDNNVVSNTSVLSINVTEPSYARAVLLATNSITIGSGNTVVSGDVIVDSSATSGYELETDSYCEFPAGYAIKADQILLGSGSDVYGDAYYNQLTTEPYVTVHGNTYTSLNLPVIADLPEFLTSNSGTQDVTVGTYGNLVLQSGSYGDLYVGSGAVLTLSGGTYYFDSIETSSYCKIYFEDVSTVMVNYRLTLGSTIYMGPAHQANISPADIVVYVNGADVFSRRRPSYESVSTSSYDTLSVNIYAPNGTAYINSGVMVTGSILAKNIESSSYVTFALDHYHSLMTVPLNKSIATQSMEDGSETIMPESFILEQNYPNPFNPTTTIEYVLPEDGLVTLQVFSTTGQLIATLVDEQQNAGMHSAVWNALHVPSGVYFYQLKTKAHVKTRKMVLMK